LSIHQMEQMALILRRTKTAAGFRWVRSNKEYDDLPDDL